MINSTEIAQQRPVRTFGAGLRRTLVAGAMALAVPVAVSADTLADALAGAYNTSGLLEQNRALLRAADEDVAGTLAGLRPVIGWSTDIRRSYSNSSGVAGLAGVRGTSSGATNLNAGITAEWLIYDFGRTRLSTEAAKEIVLSTRQNLVSIEQQVLLRAVQAYMDVQRNTRFVSIRRSNVGVISESLRAARDRFEVGEVTRTDVAQAESRLSLSRSNLAQAVGDLERAKEEYLAVVGNVPRNINQPRSLPALTRTEETAKQIALRNHPDMLRAQHDVAAAKLNVLVAESAMKPRVTLNAAIGVTERLNGNSAGQTGEFGVQIGGPIYQGGALASAKRRAFALSDAQLGILHQTKDRVRQNVGNAYAVLEAARASAAATAEAVRAGRVAFDGVNEEATLGARTTLDVLNAEQEYLDAQADQISAQADVIIASYAVLATMGELTVRDLNLAVQTYDPAAYYNLVKDAPAALSERGQSLDRVLRKIGKQ
ncbi:TolC family outer membrane protein [Roseovarius sp. M141]|uniref:TolC family outer membrane protein n=1 Tax=Roseovarius sp. M141 TaxID=2583806 RepID=UPI0020CFC127|nr:TolC family outer membrane protein [Roseovarius sp. M141]MCQ0092282.1 TolC family outer membrane protein [Roseovarius sp. M141]